MRMARDACNYRLEYGRCKVEGVGDQDRAHVGASGHDNGVRGSLRACMEGHMHGDSRATEYDMCASGGWIHGHNTCAMAMAGCMQVRRNLWTTTGKSGGRKK